MIDDHADPGPDPLSGKDPHPREQIDLWPLHDARQELLEEIVSQPGPGESPARTKVLLSVVGIAAALAIVGGGAWFVVSDDDSKSDDQVAASSDAPSQIDTSDVASDATEATDATTAETDEPSESAEPTVTPIDELKKGDALTPRQCRLIRHGWVDVDVRRHDGVRRERLTRTLGELSYVVRMYRKDGKTRWVSLIRVGKGNRYLGVDKDCVVTSVGKLRVRN